MLVSLLQHILRMQATKQISEHPEIRAYTIDPGLPHTKMTLPDFVPYAKDDPALTGGLSLFLSTPKADWLKGQTIGAFCKST